MDQRRTRGGAPDLGLRYLEEGLAGALVAFRRLGFEQISRVAPGRFHIATSLALETTYAVSYELDRAALATLLGALPARLGAALDSELARPGRGTLSVGLPRVLVDVTARLGRRRGAGDATFAPFEVASAGPPSALAAVYVVDP